MKMRVVMLMSELTRSKIGLLYFQTKALPAGSHSSLPAPLGSTRGTYGLWMAK